MTEAQAESPKPRSAEFKNWCIDEYRTRTALGISTVRICADLGVPRSTLYLWIDEKIAPGPSTSPGRDHNHGEGGGSPQQDTSGETTTNGGIQ